MQHDILDRMGRAEILALAVGGADEVFLVLRKVGSAALIHFAAALCAIQKPGEHTHFTHLGRTATRLANVLNNQEHAFFDDRRLGVLEDHPILRIIPDFLLALVGLLCGLEVYCMPQIVYALQNAGNRFICPFVRVCCRLVAGRQTFRMAIGGWVQDLLLFEPFSNLRGAFAGRAQGEYLLYDGCGFFIDDPFLFVLRAFHIPIGRNGRQMLAGLAFALPCSANLFGGIAGIHFVEHIADRGKLTFAACAVHAVIDGNEMNAKLRENNIGIHSHLEIIAPEAAHVLYNDTLDPPSLDVGKHTLEARTVEVCAGITIVLVIMAVGGNPVILAVAFQNLLLVRYGVTFTIQLIFLRKALIQSGQTFFLCFRR